MAAKKKGGGRKTPSDGTHHRFKTEKKKAFERTGMKPPRPGSEPAAEAPYEPEPMADGGSAGVLPPLLDDNG